MIQIYLIKKVLLFMICSIIMGFCLISCSKKINISELDGWSMHNSSIINNDDADYMTYALFFQVENSSIITTGLEDEIIAYLKKSSWEARIKSHLFTKPKNWHQVCLFYRKKYFSAYSYDVYQSMDFEDFGGFYGERENLLGYIEYYLIDEKLYMNAHIYEKADL